MNENNNANHNNEGINNNDNLYSTSNTENYNEYEDNYPRGYQQDDQYYSNTNYNNYNTQTNETYNYYNATQEQQYNDSQNNNKKPKKAKKINNKGNKKAGKVVKVVSAVAGVTLIAFSGGLLGGYIANNDKNTSGGTTTKVIDPSYIAADFLNSSTDNDDETLSVAEAINKVAPAVVTISIKSKSTSSNPFYGSDVTEGIGSGFIIDKEGRIITNYHVIENATEVNVLLSTGEEVGATVINYDQEKDIAMIQLNDTSKIPGVAELGDSDALYAGQEVIAIGTPLSTEFSATCTKGIVSAINRDVETDTGITMNLIQTDAAINPGNSGGPLINSKGQVIGINSMKLVTTEVEGIGFAIPINEAADRIERLSKKIITLGITIVPVTDEISKETGYPLGLYVNDVSDFSCAQKGGLKIGDVITSFNGKRIKTADELSEAKSECEVGDKVKVVVVRDDKEKTLEITLE